MLSALRRPVDFRSRAARPEFWLWVPVFLGAEALAFLAGVPGALSLWLLLLVIPHAAVVIRRLHDLGASGWWAAPHLLTLATGTLGTDLLALFLQDGATTPAPDSPLLVALFANNLFYLVYTVALAVALAGDGTPGPNRFGPDPKRRDPGPQP